MTAGTFYRDSNFIPITNLGLITKKTITFAGGTTGAWGDDGGTLDGAALFTVTGLVQAQVLGVCTTSLGGANATVEVGITGNTAIFLPIETGTQIDAGQIWVNDAANGTSIILGGETAATGNLPLYLLNGNDIILTVKTADVTSGVIDFYCIWTPISSDASVVDSEL